MFKLTKKQFEEHVRRPSDIIKSQEKHKQHYLNYFEKYQKGQVINWHWPALLVPFYWLLYRRMPFFALGVVVLEQAIVDFVGKNYVYLLHVVVALFADYFYVQSVSWKGARGKPPEAGRYLSICLFWFVFMGIFVLMSFNYDLFLSSKTFEIAEARVMERLASKNLMWIYYVLTFKIWKIFGL